MCIKPWPNGRKISLQQRATLLRHVAIVWPPSLQHDATQLL